MEKTISIEDIGLFETEKLINTPRSLEACKKEGIEPEDLLYLPLEFFCQEKWPKEIQVLYYEFFEYKRKLLLKSIKEIREGIIKETSKNRKSYSSSVYSEKMKLDQEIIKCKEKQKKNIGKILSTERNILKEMAQKHKEYLNNLQLSEEKKKNKAKLDKQKIEEKRIKEIQKCNSLIGKLKSDKKIALEIFNNKLKFKTIEEMIEEQKSKEKELLKKQSEQKMKEHLYKMEEYLAKMREEKQKKIKSKEIIEKNRQDYIKKQLKTTRIKIRSKSKKNEKKRIQMLNKLEEENNKKKTIYEEKIKIGAEKSSEIVQIRAELLKERLRSKSQERLTKTIQAYEMNEEELKKRRNKLLRKYENIEKRNEQNKEFMRQETEIKKHRDILKEFNKE